MDRVCDNIQEMIMQGVIGEVKPVHSEWMLDTRHGEDFLRRRSATIAVVLPLTSAVRNHILTP
jgi:hypothetical protein